MGGRWGMAIGQPNPLPLPQLRFGLLLRLLRCFSCDKLHSIRHTLAISTTTANVVFELEPRSSMDFNASDPVVTGNNHE